MDATYSALKLFLVHIKWELSGIYGKISEQTYTLNREMEKRQFWKDTCSVTFRVGRSNFMIFSYFPLIQTLL